MLDQYTFHWTGFLAFQIYGKKQKIADYSTLPVTKKVYGDIDNATRMKLRNEQLEQQFKKNQNDSE